MTRKAAAVPKICRRPRFWVLKSASKKFAQQSVACGSWSNVAARKFYSEESLVKAYSGNFICPRIENVPTAVFAAVPGCPPPTETL